METITQMQFFNMSLSEGYLLLDIRNTENYCQKHVTGSFSMPLQLTAAELERRYIEILNNYYPENWDPIVFIGYQADVSNLFMILKNKFSFLGNHRFNYFYDLKNWPEFLSSQSENNNIENIHQEFEKLEPYPSEILQNIYLGNRENAFNKNVINNLNITHILSLNKDAKYDHGISQLNFPIDDDNEENIIYAYNMVKNFLNEAYGNGKLLIHCDQGKSRSVAILILFLNERLGISFENLLDYIKKQRRIAQPNPGFIDQVRTYIAEHAFGRPITPKSRAAHKLIRALILKN
jgi:protein-tyrosine phosphatase